MNKKSMYSFLLIVSLLGLISLSAKIQNVNAPYLIITIEAGGSISPTPVNITTSDNVTYTFTADINASIIVQRSDIIIDGDGYTLTGPYTEIGFNLTDLTNVIIRNVNVVGFGYGIYLQSSTLSIISGNNITFNEGNIYLGNSSDNTITGNTITNGAEAIQLYASSSNTISGNSMSHNNNGVWARSNSTDNVISGNNMIANLQAGVYLNEASNNSIIRNEIISDNYGVYLTKSSSNKIIENNLTANHGIPIFNSHNNTLYKNSIEVTYIGIDIFGEYNVISGNTIMNCGTGFFFGSNALYNTISGNIIENNDYGLYFEQTSNNTIIGNDIVNNTHGISLDWYSHNMRIYHNSFRHNTNHMDVSNTANLNFLDNGFEGNYWSNYTGTDADRDGIGDTPHVIDANNTDYYPLMGMFHSFNTSVDEYVNVISNSTVTYFNYWETHGRIIIQVRNATTEQASGFCRISIPHNLTDPEFTWVSVFIDDGTVTPLHLNTTLYDNGAHRWIYVAYPHPYSLHEIVVIIPEFPTFIILPLFMAATLLAALMFRRKHNSLE